jgi:hypothetical protein
MSNLPKIIENPALFGVIEWIVLQGGTITKFNNYIILGEIHNLRYRYFFSEGWIGLFTNDCPPGKSWEIKSLDEFQDYVAHYAGEDKILRFNE